MELVGLSWASICCGPLAAVNAGEAGWGVPRYNGGLFSAGRREGQDNDALDENPHKAAHRLLADSRIGALYLCRALDLLGRDIAARNANTVEGARRLIDYAALDVRRLGSIYEGLLEYQLEQPELADGEPPRLELPRTYGGRKSSGSYYTPDYIVAYEKHNRLLRSGRIEHISRSVVCRRARSSSARATSGIVDSYSRFTAHMHLWHGVPPHRPRRSVCHLHESANRRARTLAC